MKKRLFVAINLPQDTKEEIEKILPIYRGSTSIGSTSIYCNLDILQYQVIASSTFGNK